MTNDRDFKQQVRARMARTGERYAAARARLVADDPRRGPRAASDAGTTAAATASRSDVTAGRHETAGRHAETAGLVRLLAAAGVTWAGRAVDEAAVLGLGGGLGAAAFVFAYAGHTPTFYLATRCQPQYPYDANFVRTAAARLGATCAIAETTSAAVAARALTAHVARGPVLAWVDHGALPWSSRQGGVAELGAVPHVIVVESIAGDHATVRDTAAPPFALELAALAAARKRLRIGKHRLLTVAAGPAPDARAVRASIDAALVACAAELGGRTKVRGPMAKNFGLPGLRRWADQLASTRDPRRWTKIFAPPHAASALAWGRYWIDHGGTGGGGFRPLYADFLDGAAALTRRPALRTLAARYRALGVAWSALATAMLPDTAPALAAIRRAQDAQAVARARGDLDAIAATQAATAAALAAPAARALAPDLVGALYADLAARLAPLLAEEEAAAAVLASV